MLSTQAFCTNVLSFSDEDHGSNGHNYSKIVVSTNKIELLIQILLLLMNLRICIKIYLKSRILMALL